MLLVNEKHNYRRNDHDPNQELALLLCHHRFTAADQLGGTRHRQRGAPAGFAHGDQGSNRLRPVGLGCSRPQTLCSGPQPVARSFPQESR